VIYEKRDQLKALNKMNFYDWQKAALHSRAAFYLSPRSRCIFSWHERQRLIRLDSFPLRRLRQLPSCWTVLVIDIIQMGMKAY